jgi:beta-mannosidase
MTLRLHTHIALDGSDWEFKSFYGLDWLLRNAHKPDTRDLRGWLSGGTVPGSIVDDLWKHGDIPDPYVDQNSLLIEWVPQRTWLYRNRFAVPLDLQDRRITLHFAGVDYAAQFFLNGEKLGEHASMYTPVAFDVGALLNYGAENLLVVVLEPAPFEQPQVGRTSLVRTHKSRMTYWWDFCPRMIHLGIWDRVALQASGPTRIDDVWVQSHLNDDYTRATVSVQVTLGGDSPVDVIVTIAQAGEIVAQQTITRASESIVSANFAVDNPALWWPNGAGDQPLYEARVTLADPAHDAEYDARTASFGIRKIEFVPNDTPDMTALPYTARVNGRRIYVRGWNWVPMDVLYGVERADKLEHLLTLARDANVNMLRVWGGGLIEKEAFYDLCDRLGIMVWQEFIQSSSGIDNLPPDDPAFLARLESEARAIVPRKRNHPSLTIWGGGNELTYGPEQPIDDQHPNTAMLRRVVEELDPGRMWLASSPTGRAFSNDLTQIERDPLAQHDVHGPWEHQGLTAQYTLYNKASSLLHSEFGAEGITNRKTLDATVCADAQRPVTLDNPLWFHRGAWWVKVPQWDESLGLLDDLNTLLQGTQYLQAEGVRYALEANRRRQFQNSGSLPWQFNEPYPMAACTSAVDYFGHPKPLYYAVARAYNPVLVAARFATQSWMDRASFEADLWCVCSSTSVVDGTVRARLVGLDGARYAEQQAQVTIPSDGVAGPIPFTFPLNDLPELFFLDLALTREAEIIADNRYLFTRQPTLNSVLHQPEAQIAVDREAGPDYWRVSLHNPSDFAALTIWLEDDRPRRSAGWPHIRDNYFSLLPDETRIVNVQWHGVPVAERRIAISGWNIASVTV